MWCARKLAFDPMAVLATEACHGVWQQPARVTGDKRAGAVQLAVHCAKNYMHKALTKIRVPLILGVWGGKGQGKTFQVRLPVRPCTMPMVWCFMIARRRLVALHVASQGAPTRAVQYAVWHACSRCSLYSSNASCHLPCSSMQVQTTISMIEQGILHGRCNDPQSTCGCR